ncbi:MAG: hypothetical protein RIF46_02590 [Cyclobacteriaceae bacterium]
MKVTDTEIELLAKEAWTVRKSAFLKDIGSTKVGASLLSVDKNTYSGCNVQHVFRNDIHAEVSAISNMISHGETSFICIVIVAERERFTPCGSCMDWIMQHGGEDCIVAYQNYPNGPIKTLRAKELMPFYPT